MNPKFLILGILLSLNKLSPFFLNINLSEVMTVIPWNPGTSQVSKFLSSPLLPSQNGVYIFRK